MHLPAWAGRTRVTGHVCVAGDACPAAPTTSRHLLPALLRFTRLLSSSQGCAALPGMHCTERAGSGLWELSRRIASLLQSRDAQVESGGITGLLPQAPTHSTAMPMTQQDRRGEKMPMAFLSWIKQILALCVQC